ncbi:ABC-ATPase domain-containing protein [Blautia sp. MSJ-19]|uniref:ABC-ATPase domain-containing protein n=1 Tax=Blautia sp. MSJ-19 TaxID=2841517 RepID=UPI001C0F38A3|nr:ABC-ATPase domain-containing protein [Blautia sp. MSJ-19]MBU5479900.1 ABC-ATPase domain-containing protein [Blautia sp. MSJ-19]
MQNASELKTQLQSVNRKSYPAYKSLKGSYQFDRYILSVDHVQGDPFASPSHISIHVSRKDAGFPDTYCKNPLTRTTLADYLTRQFERQVNQYTFRAKGSGKSGLISVSHCGQEVLARSACEITDKDIIARFFIGFPANGRTINATELEKILFDFLPVCVQKAFFYRNVNKKELEQAIFLAEDQQAIRCQLKEQHLVAFVADHSVLPRESGISSRPLKDSVPFISPGSLCVTMDLPHKGQIRGMGIPQGITLIVGGGYHGKSTLLNALELGVYNHIAGDGREYVITDASALKLRSEDGRFIKDVDISLFINDLPNKKDTRCFSTADASGSTSQAAGIIEGMEAGSKVFLLDEDTSATNFMVRDTFMQEVISREKEPITPFLERAQDLYKNAGISTILVAGSSGAFFHIADTIIQMDCYHPVDIADKVRNLCGKYPLNPVKAPAFTMPISHRIIQKNAPAVRSHGRGAGKPERIKIKVHGKDGFSLGRQDVDLRYIEQIVDSEQTAALGLLLKYALEHLADGQRTLPEIVEYLQKQIQSKGLASLADGSYLPCGYAVPRIQEIYSCFNRYRR